MNKLRVLHLFNAFRMGGVERQHLLLVKELHETFEQVCWAINHGPVEEALDELGVPHCCSRVWTIPAIMEHTRFDCVILRTYRGLKEVGDYLRQSPTPVVYTRNYFRWPGSLEYFDPEWEKLGVSVADYCLFSGPMLKAPVMEYLGEVPGGDIIYNGLRLEDYPLRERTAPPEDRPLRVGFLANLAPHKNQAEAVRVLRPGLSEKRFELYLGGESRDDAYEQEVHREARGLSVTFLGYVADPVDFFRNVDVMLMASTQEGWPNVLMEAFACGVPAIAPMVGDIPEVFGGRPPGFIYPAAQYHRIPDLLEAFRDPVVYEEKSRLAVSRAKDFDIKKSARLLERAVRTVVKERQ